MTFTEDDIENTALIKQEIGSKVQTVASRKNPDIMDYYRRLVEGDYGLKPGDDLADMVIRAINDEDFANTILNTEVTLRQARINNIREEDLDFVLDMQEKLDHGDAEDKVGEFIDSYMDTISSGGGLGLSIEDRRKDKDVDKSRQILREMREERARLETLREELRGEASGGTSKVVDVTTESSGEEKDVEDLFDEGTDDVAPGVPIVEKDVGGEEAPLSSEEGVEGNDE